MDVAILVNFVFKLGIGLKVGTQDEDPTNAGSLMYLKNYVHMKPTFE